VPLKATYTDANTQKKKPTKQIRRVKINLDLTIVLEKGDNSTYCIIAVMSKNTIRLKLSEGKYSKKRYPLIIKKHK